MKLRYLLIVVFVFGITALAMPKVKAYDYNEYDLSYIILDLVFAESADEFVKPDFVSNNTLYTFAEVMELFTKNYAVIINFGGYYTIYGDFYPISPYGPPVGGTLVDDILADMIVIKKYGINQIEVQFLGNGSIAAYYRFPYGYDYDETTFLMFLNQPFEYQLGYGNGYRDGYTHGFGDGAAEADTTYGGVFGIITSSLFAPIALIFGLEIFPNLTLGMIILIPLIFGLIAFIIGGRKND